MRMESEHEVILRMVSGREQHREELLAPNPFFPTKKQRKTKENQKSTFRWEGVGRGHGGTTLAAQV